MPVFGAAAVRNMFPAMEDIISQLVAKWERFGPEYVINPTVDYTKLTLDAISLASMSYRMNSFYTEGMVPFVAAMNRYLTECQLRANRPRLVTAVMTNTQVQFDADIKLMSDIANSIVQKRKENPTEPGAHKDLLDQMLTAVDTKTGEKMTDASIVDNV
jgi:cytochrome P450/NADPH-cytochrome P450 reductase